MPRPRPHHALARVGPNWFGSVMGTGMVANAAALLPHSGPALDAFATGVWVAAAALLAVLLAVTAAHWRHHPEHARGHLGDPVMLPFHGTLPMALLTVGAGALLVGDDVLGPTAATRVGVGLWVTGTALGLLCATVVPALMLRRHARALADVSPTWLLAVVPPLVSAATGAAVLDHVHGDGSRELVLAACFAMAGLSLLLVLGLLPVVVLRLAVHGPGEPRAVPALFIVLGPLGQAVTALGLLASAGDGVLPDLYGDGLEELALMLGAPILTFALLWLALAAAVTLRTARDGLPFSLAWWSFTFPVGTCVTGTTELSALTGSAALSWVAVALFGLLVAAWAVAAARSAHRTLLLRPAPAR